MPTFTGTSREFKRYIGPRLRNYVQMLTKKHKANVGACEHCGAGKELEAAHLKERDRNQIILLSAISSESVVTVELQQFEESFKSEHHPVEKAILILCRQCHNKYDTAIYPAPPSTSKSPSIVKPAGAIPMIHLLAGGFLIRSLKVVWHFALCRIQVVGLVFVIDSKKPKLITT